MFFISFCGELSNEAVGVIHERLLPAISRSCISRKEKKKEIKIGDIILSLFVLFVSKNLINILPKYCYLHFISVSDSL